MRKLTLEKLEGFSQIILLVEVEVQDFIWVFLISVGHVFS
jgi:hypothetical protein